MRARLLSLTCEVTAVVALAAPAVLWLGFHPVHAIHLLVAGVVTAAVISHYGGFRTFDAGFREDDECARRAVSAPSAFPAEKNDAHGVNAVGSDSTESASRHLEQARELMKCIPVEVRHG